MKPLIIVCLAFISLSATAQDTAKVVDCKLKKNIDPYTKEKTLSTGFIELTGGSVSIDATKAEIDMLFSVTGSDKCFSDASTANIFFVGIKYRQMQRNNGSMNCEGLFHFIFRNTTTPTTLLKKLATQKIEKIVFTGNNKVETTITLTPEQQQAVMDLTACMVKDAPGLSQ